MTLSDIISSNVAPFLHADISSAEGLARVKCISSLVSSHDVFHFGFETRLYSPEPLVDFGVCFTENGKENSGLRATLRRLGEVGGDQLVTTRIRRCVDLWTRHGGPALEPMNTWLEFDLIVPERPPLSNPSFFFSVPVTFWEQLECGCLLDQTMKLLADDVITPECLATLHVLRSAVPQGAWVFSVGLMFGRVVQHIRVGIRSIRASDIISYLRHTAWPGDAHYVQSILETIQFLTERIDITLDISNGKVAKSLGLECYFLPQERNKWSKFLEFICTEQMGLRQKVEAICFFPCLVREGQRIQSLEDGDRVAFCYELSVHHIKLSVGEFPGKAKAYLSILRRQN
jgi:hypothetical protein